MTNYWIGFVIAVLGFILAKLEPKLRELVKKSNTKIDDTILNVALWIVPQVDTIFNGSSGESKLQRAKDLVTIELAKQGVKNVDEKVIENNIEKALTITKVDEYVKNNENLVPVGDEEKK